MSAINVPVEGAPYFEMSASALGFEIGETNVFQTLLSKNRDNIAEVPLTRADLYRP